MRSTKRTGGNKRDKDCERREGQFLVEKRQRLRQGDSACREQRAPAQASDDSYTARVNAGRKTICTN